VTVTQSAGSPSLNSEVMAVGGLVEVLGVADLHGDGDGIPRQEHGAEQRLLGFQIVGWYPARL